MTARGFRWGHALLAGTAASSASALVVAWRSERETGSAWSGLNAISHWLFGARAYGVDAASVPHAVAGLAIHQASSLVWGALYELLICNLRGGRPTASAQSAAMPGAEAVFIERRPATSGDAAAAAAIVAALAAYTDLRLVPPPLSPGFEHRLARGSIALTYLGFACGLAAMGMALARTR